MTIQSRSSVHTHPVYFLHIFHYICIYNFSRNLLRSSYLSTFFVDRVLPHRIMSHWLDAYANNYHKWHQVHVDGEYLLYRPLGLVETAFDNDGLYFEGRADINALLKVEVKSQLTDEQWRKRIILTWTVLRLHHVLLMAKAADREAYMTVEHDSARRFFVISPPQDAQKQTQFASEHVVFVDSSSDRINVDNLYQHAQNTARVLDPTQALARLFVLPRSTLSKQRSSLSFLFILSHQISDGLTNFTWLNHFVKLLNTPIFQLETSIFSLSTINSIQSRLPSAQEDLYPRISGSKAKKRWFWLLSVVLRHVKKPLPAAFTNPLRRDTADSSHIEPIYNDLLDYSKTPPTRTGTCHTTISKQATKRLYRLCREVGASIGAGSFVLAAMVMMSFYESRVPNIPLESRQSFIGSFPINPRPFFNHTEAPNSMMLAFSDGIVLPFLPSELDLEGRFKLLVRQASRQLALYQKRKKPNGAGEGAAYMGSRGAGRMTAMNYISAVERTRAKLPDHLKDSLGSHSPQGELAVQPNPTMATCGISSVGKSGWKIGEFDLDAELVPGEDAFVADFRSLRQNVRARDGEFLVGIGGGDDGIHVSVSYDARAMDEDLVNEWKMKMETFLLDSPKSKL